MICNLCDSRVEYHRIKGNWICTGCKTHDPPIRIQPFKPIDLTEALPHISKIAANRMKGNLDIQIGAILTGIKTIESHRSPGRIARHTSPEESKKKYTRK